MCSVLCAGETDSTWQEQGIRLVCMTREEMFHTVFCPFHNSSICVAGCGFQDNWVPGEVHVRCKGAHTKCG